MAPETQSGERYATQVGELWTGLSQTLARLEAIAASPERLEDDEAVEALRRLQYRLHSASESVLGLSPPVAAEPAHTELAAALAGARDATGDVVEAVDLTGSRGVDVDAPRMARRALPRSARPAAPDRAADAPRGNAARRSRSSTRRSSPPGSPSPAPRPSRSARPPAPGRSGSPGCSRSACRYCSIARSRRQRLVAPEQLEALEEPGRDLRARDREPDRGERLARLQPLGLGERPQRLLDPGRLPRLDRAERLGGGARTRPGRRRPGETGSNRKRTKSGYCENFSIFSCTSGTVARTRSSGHSIPCSPSQVSSAAAYASSEQLAQVHAVQPVELLVVEGRRARPDALEREPLDELRAGSSPSSCRRSSSRAARGSSSAPPGCSRPRGTRRSRPRRGASRASCRRRRSRPGRARTREASRRAPCRMLICVGVFETWSLPRITCVIPSSMSSTGEAKL